MLKRAISYIWNSERAPVVRAAEQEYEKWSKQQLIDKIRELEASSDSATVAGKMGAEAHRVPKKQEKKKQKPFDHSKHSTRFIALRFAYLGWNYNGLAFQLEPTPLPTIEDEILKALTLAKLIPEADPHSCNFSRCGRTDKGVSAMNQVISLDVRSNLSAEDQKSNENDKKEVPYLTILNSLLPPDIRITSVCLRPPPEFDARFSCKYRHYRYIFKKYDDIDLDLMQEAAKKYEGKHDFRNFCKIDGSKQINNYKRDVYSANIIKLNERFYAFDLKGTAFLWHQVRCMMAILFSVAQKLEKPSLVDDLLNVEKFPARPNFGMAHDIPLVLYDCVYPEMEWLDTKNPTKLLKEYSAMNGLVSDYQVKAELAGMMEEFYMTKKAEPMPGSGVMNVGDGKGRTYKKYVPVSTRELNKPYQLVNEIYRQKKRRRLDEASIASGESSDK